MRKWILFAMSLFLFTIVSGAGAQDPDPSLSVTIYNQGTALVQDRRAFTLEPGLNTLDFTDVAASIDATSVSIKSLTDPQNTVVLEQNYVYDLVGSGALLSRYIDETIQVVTTDGETFTGQLLSGRGGEIILRSPDGQVQFIRQDQARNITFPSLPDGLITRPTLRWLIQSATGGEQQLELTYLTGGINWTADYILLLTRDNAALDLNGWVTLTNQSGTAYDDAQVKLVAGDVNRVQPELMRAEVYMDAMPVATPQMAGGATQREFFEYQLYELNRRVTLGNNETKQVEFVTGAGIPASTYFVYRGAYPFGGYYGPISDQYYGDYGITTVENWLEFTTDADGGLGADLPAGRVRVYQQDIDGAALLIGENRISHPPEGEDVRFYLGNAFDLVGERRQTDFRMLARNVIEESFEIRLRNRKDTDTVEIRVPETLFRWSNWEILSSSDAYTRLDAGTIEFRVDVAPGEERVITYTVRYSWAG